MRRTVSTVLGFVLLGCGSVRTPTTQVASATDEGAALYDQYCALCHGAQGEGYAADNATRLRGQSLLRTSTDEFLQLAIASGRSQTAMAGYSQELGGPLTNEEIDRLVAHLRAWQEGPAIEAPGGDAHGDPERGSRVFERHCASCHGQLAQGETAQSLNRAAFLSEASDAFLRYAIVHGREETPMPGFESKLQPQEIEDLVVFLRRFEQQPDVVPKHLSPPELAEMQIIRHESGPSPSFTLREGRFVPAAQVEQALASKARLIVLDARTTSDWLIERIPGALPVPYYEIAPIVERLPRDGTWILAYCGCPHAASGQVIDALREAGFENTAVIDEGIFHWIEQGYPTESGAYSSLQ
jgi:mono/diheme cytochrome c family protein/rhodanese-related sulfurtransferase